jgi:D-serine deaminase-like pyridoxal phosphate-dependent protein
VFDRAIARYERFVAHTRRAHPSLWSPTLTLDSAGSPTYRLHERETLCNDLAVGTALLKPSHYDLPLLAEHRPAVFLAAPVLKALPRLELPVLDRASSWIAAWDPNLAATWFLYGGNWAADLVSPRGLRKSRIYAPSANHEGFHGSESVDLAVGDHVFYRPHQVEATLGQLGDILAVRGGRIESCWPVMSG